MLLLLSIPSLWCRWLILAAAVAPAWSSDAKLPVSAANRELCGVNNEWVNCLGTMVQVNRDAHGHPGSWLPPNIEEWVNRSDPFNSARLSLLLAELKLGSYRYPGGSIGNFWNWSSDAFSPLANDSFHTTIAQVQAQAFPPGAFGVKRFDEMLQRAGARNILSLDVSTAGPDASIPRKVVQQLGRERANRFEIGNEVYDPRQGPPPNGYTTAQHYLADTEALIEQVRAVGATAGVTIGPCPFFYPNGSDCWGGENGRYHQWHRNLSKACRRTSDGGCPFDALIAHNYVTTVELIGAFQPKQMLSVFLAVPQVTMDFGAASMRRDFGEGIRLWVTEFNTMYAGVWGGKADDTYPAAASFLNKTENSAAHAVHVAAYIVASMTHGSLVEMMNYHSFLEGVAPLSLGPHSTGGGQPGFATAAINDTALYISPVAQMLSMLSRMLTPGHTMEAVPTTATIRGGSLPFDLAAAGLGDAAVACIHAAAICANVSIAAGGDHIPHSNRTVARAGSSLLAINRCSHPATISLRFSCASAHTGWGKISVFNATLSKEGPGHTWVRLGEPGPMIPFVDKRGGIGDQVALAPLALTIIELQ